MKNTGLILNPVSAAFKFAFQAQQRLVEDDSHHMCALDQWQPNWIFVSDGYEFKKIASVDLFHPLNVHPYHLKAAAIRKQEGYFPLVSALSHYTEQGWAWRPCRAQAGIWSNYSAESAHEGGAGYFRIRACSD
jgi:hypothetical protein